MLSAGRKCSARRPRYWRRGRWQRSEGVCASWHGRHTCCLGSLHRDDAVCLGRRHRCLLPVEHVWKNSCLASLSTPWQNMSVPHRHGVLHGHKPTDEGAGREEGGKGLRGFCVFARSAHMPLGQLAQPDGEGAGTTLEQASLFCMLTMQCEGDLVHFRPNPSLEHLHPTPCGVYAHAHVAEEATQCSFI